MALYQFHRVLIAAAILFCLGFALYSYRVFTASGSTAHGWMALASAAACALAVAYLAYFNVTLRANRLASAATHR